MKPEHEAPPEIYYNQVEAKKYTENSRIIAIQNQMAYRAIELLALPTTKITSQSSKGIEIVEKPIPSLLLDIGCGSGLSGEVLDEDGHIWVGLDISESMLDVARDRDVQGDLFLQDIGQGLGYRPGTFDGAISISVIQWLCNADKSSHVPQKRLSRFFTTLYTALARGARAVFQFYPENPDQVEMIVSSAMKCGFTGGLVVDYPHSSKAKKYFLCLFAGGQARLPDGLDNENTVGYTASARVRTPHSRKSLKDKSWVLRKKEVARARGRQTASDSKYTARKRKPAF